MVHTHCSSGNVIVELWLGLQEDSRAGSGRCCREHRRQREIPETVTARGRGCGEELRRLWCDLGREVGGPWRAAMGV